MVRNCIMVATDPVLVNSYVCSLLHYSTDDVPYIGLAEGLGAGSSDLSSLRLITCEGDPYEDLPEQDMLDASYAVDEIDSCSACYGVLIPALERLKSEGLFERIPAPVGIGQGAPWQTR